MLKFLFFFSFAIILYSYIGYGLFLYLLVKLRQVLKAGKTIETQEEFLPEVTLIIAAYNEAGFIEQKIKNSLDLNYPPGRLHWIIVTDGSTDDTAAITGNYPQIILLDQPERAGKTSALNRAMRFVQTPYVIFSDANTILNSDAVNEIIQHYRDPGTGGVSGEKKIMSPQTGPGPAYGEGMYWKYESLLKKLDSSFYTVVGAAGELFSMRTALYRQLPEGTILDDFVQSLLLCSAGYRVQYEPRAIAMETGSASIREEEKRKIRIAAGAFQAMRMLKGLLNVFRYPLLSFQYVSHRVLRWTLCPVCLVLLYFSNAGLVISRSGEFFIVFFLGQTVFYAMALLGWFFASRGIKYRILYIPYYFLFMNLSVFSGFSRYVRKKQPVLWEKAAR